MKKLDNTEVELKNDVTYKKSMLFTSYQGLVNS